jgi:hypothetical protein
MYLNNLIFLSFPIVGRTENIDPRRFIHQKLLDPSLPDSCRHQLYLFICDGGGSSSSGQQQQQQKNTSIFIL